MHCKIWDGQIDLYHTQGLYWWKNYGTVRWEKNALSKSASYREMENWDALVKKGNDIKAYIVDVKELFVLE